MRTLQSVESHSVGCAMRTLHLLVANNRDFTRKKMVYSRHPLREKLKEDYSFLQSSSFQLEVEVEIAVNCQLSTVNF